MPALLPCLGGSSDAEQDMGYICLFVTGEDIDVVSSSEFLVRDCNSLAFGATEDLG